MSATAPLPLDLATFPPVAREVFEALQAILAELRARSERQEHLITELRHALYGRKSEKLDHYARQLAFEDLEVALAEIEAALDAGDPQRPDVPAKRPAAQRNLGHLPAHLPRIEEIIEPDEAVCPCGCTDLVKIGEDGAERLDVIPARFQVIVTVPPKYVCRRCDTGILQAAAPARLIERGLPTEGTMAHVAVSKYAHHLSLFRQSQIYRRGGVDLDRSSLASWCGRTAFHLAPVVAQMLDHLKRSDPLFMEFAGDRRPSGAA